MKAAIVLVLALVAASQARSAVPAGIFEKLTDVFPHMNCAVDYMRDYLHKECYDIATSRCQENGEAVMNEIMEKCFATQQKESAKTGAHTRDGDAESKFFKCLIKDSWKIITGQTDNPLSILECLNIHN